MEMYNFSLNCLYKVAETIVPLHENALVQLLQNNEVHVWSFVIHGNFMVGQLINQRAKEGIPDNISGLA